MPAPKTALIIDDDQMLGEALRSMLETQGYETTYCESGTAALELTKERKFDVILTEYRMPDMNGAQVTRELRFRCPDAFIVGISAENRREEFIEAGANVFFSKPLPFEVLSSLIEKIDAVSQRMKCPTFLHQIFTFPVISITSESPYPINTQRRVLTGDRILILIAGQGG